MNTNSSRVIILLIFILKLVFITPYANAQITIGADSPPDKSAALDLKSANKGLLIPRVSLKGATDIVTVPDPAHSLIVYNLTDGDNGTPSDAKDDVHANNFYIFSKVTNSWSLLVTENFLTEKLAEIGVPQLALSVSVEAKESGNDQTYLSRDHDPTVRDNVRTMYFKRKIYDPNNAYNTETSEFTASVDGYYNVEAHIFLRSYKAQNNVEGKVNRLGISKPYVGNFVYNGNASFVILNQPINPVTSTDTPLTISVSGIIYMEKGQKICVLTRYIIPGVTSGNNVYSLDTESLGIKREEANMITITYFPTNK